MINTYINNILNKSQRIFTALDRDPNSPTYGSFDRDFWHYKIRDFSSMVLHQASLSVNSLYLLDNEDNIYYKKPVLKDWINASITHWMSEQSKVGAFNEYYPYEEGYPPTAFSLYATSILLLSKKNIDKKILLGIEKASNWILSNPEREASNQEAIGISAVYLSSKIPGVDIDAKSLEKRFQDFFDSQDEEGWFPEYNGPDIGYLSVTVDALWDYYTYSNDKRALLAMKKACHFISLFITDVGNLPVMINSRNTDYIVPYGIFNLAIQEKEFLPLVSLLLKKITDPFNYLETTDDRYLCHYVYTSSTRAINALLKLEKSLNNCEPIELKEVYNLNSSGIFIKRQANYTLYINSKKGGVIYLYDSKNLIYTNHGFRYVSRNQIAVTHWLTEQNTIQLNLNQNSKLSIQGQMVSRKWLLPSPFKHLVLRTISFFLGRKIIPFLKKVFIFGDKQIPINFRRDIVVEEDKIEIDDILTINDNKYNLDNIVVSPYYSLRHVSSAVRFTPDELLWKNEACSTIIKKEENTIYYNTTIGINTDAK